jgi:hypothetical protein
MEFRQIIALFVYFNILVESIRKATDTWPFAISLQVSSELRTVGMVLMKLAFLFYDLQIQ